MENARVNESSTKLAALEELVRGSEKQIVGIEHHHPLVFRQTPSIDLVQCQQKALIKVAIICVRVLNITHDHNLRTFISSADKMEGSVNKTILRPLAHHFTSKSAQ